jgi:uncharacterized protein YodC (DUF2158 family)
MKFKIGDKVRVKKGVCAYTYTAPGSEGIIEQIGSASIYIRWTKLTGKFTSVPVTFAVDITDIELIDKVIENPQVYGIVKFLASIEK